MVAQKNSLLGASLKTFPADQEDVLSGCTEPQPRDSLLFHSESTFWKREDLVEIPDVNQGGNEYLSVIS